MSWLCTKNICITRSILTRIYVLLKVAIFAYSLTTTVWNKNWQTLRFIEKHLKPVFQEEVNDKSKNNAYILEWVKFRYLARFLNYLLFINYSIPGEDRLNGLNYRPQNDPKFGIDDLTTHRLRRWQEERSTSRARWEREYYWSCGQPWSSKSDSRCVLVEHRASSSYTFADIFVRK